MKYRIFDYDITEYKEFCDELNSLSEKGINPVEIGYISELQEDGKRYYYISDVIVGEKKTTKARALVELLDTYDRYDFKYIGKRGRSIFFRSETKKKMPPKRKEIFDQYMKNRLMPGIFMFLIALELMIFFVLFVLNRNTISSYITNGSIILHFLPIIMGIALIILTFNTMIVRINNIRKLKTNIQPVSKLLKKIKNGLLCMIVALLVIGIGLDYFQRSDVQVSKDMITLEDLGLKGNKEDYPTYIHSTSFVVESDVYLESSEDGVIYVKSYKFNHFGQYFINKIYEETIQVESLGINNDIVLYKIDQNYDGMILFDEDNLLIINASFDLYETNYYKIIRNVYKR